MIKRCVVPISGGQDSTVILHYVKKIEKFDEIYPISFYYGQRHSKEIDCALLQVQELGIEPNYKVVSLDFFNQLSNTSALVNKNIAVPNVVDIIGHPQPPTYVPFRNMMILSICCSYAESLNASHVYYGSAQVDSIAGYWDSSIEFINSINRTLLLNRKNTIEIKVPLIDKSKKDIVLLGEELGVDWSKTWTCYRGEDKPCGTCASCSSRKKGFMGANVIDTLKY